MLNGRVDYLKGGGGGGRARRRERGRSFSSRGFTRGFKDGKQQETPVSSKQFIYSSTVFAHLRRYPLNAANRKRVAGKDREHKACVAAKGLHLSDAGKTNDEQAKREREPVAWRWMKWSVKAYPRFLDDKISTRISMVAVDPTVS